jgi:peptidoglycan/LPS O-acetylase OafA/YrhL
MPAITGVGLIDMSMLFGAAYGATWIIATLSYNLIEEPFLRMRRTYGGMRASQAV